MLVLIYMKLETLTQQWRWPSVSESARDKVTIWLWVLGLRVCYWFFFLINQFIWKSELQEKGRSRKRDPPCQAFGSRDLMGQCSWGAGKLNSDSLPLSGPGKCAGYCLDSTHHGSQWVQGRRNQPVATIPTFVGSSEWISLRIICHIYSVQYPNDPG